ncbi:MAG: penicillin-binding transpeptidase domain-containing protein [Clostridiaceae bacterium]
MKNSNRYIAVILVTLCLFLGVLGRLFYVVVIAKDDIYAMAQNQISKEIIIPAKRGDILDRNGSLLASSTEAYRVDADLVTFRKLLVSKKRTADYYAGPLAEILGVDEAVILEKLTADNSGTIIKRKLEKSVIDSLRAYIDEENINFLLINYDNVRYYPNGNYLSHVLGSVNVDGSGVMGIEYYFNESLKGVDGIKIAEVDKKNNELPYTSVVKTNAIDGKKLVLSIDERVQYLIENIADKAMKEHDAAGVTIIVSDPKTGGILGLVNSPDYDPNNPYGDLSQEDFNEVTRNAAVNDAYEPGSTFKIVTFAAALEKGVVSEGDHYYCPGFIYVDGVRVNCSKREGHGDQSLAEVLKNSCNVGTILIAQELGKEKLNEYVKLFGFGQKTGIDLPGETTGIIFNTEAMKNIDLATASIGQGNIVSPIQILSAMNTIANKGIKNKLHLVDKLINVDNDGMTISEEAIFNEEGERVISESTSDRMMKLLYNAIGANKTSQAYSEEIEIFGKTGTAQKIVTDENGKKGYSDTEYIASFIGGAPASDPKVTVLVIVDYPKDYIFGGLVASPIAKEIILELDNYLSLD